MTPPVNVRDPDAHTDEELARMIEKMRAVSSVFYKGATHTGCHPFIEFCGLMTEYIKVCESARRAGVDFAQASTHTERPLPMKVYEAQYLAEKLDCIFGPSIRADPEVKQAFIDALGLR